MVQNNSSEVLKQALVGISWLCDEDVAYQDDTSKFFSLVV